MQNTLFHSVQKTIRRSIHTIACSKIVDKWKLAGTIPEKLILSPVDVWKGSADRARWLIHGGIFTLEGDQLELHNANWTPQGVEDTWVRYINGFEWLRDLKTLGGNKGRLAARAMVENWMDSHAHYDEVTWRPEIMGARISSWLSSFTFFGDSACEEFQEKFYVSLARQVRLLSRNVPGNLTGVDLLKAIRGLAYAGLAMEGREQLLEQALNLLHKEIGRQILSDGGHVSRCPQQLTEAVMVLIDIRTALRQGGYPCPEKILHALDRAVPALRFFRHGDRHFALFNGCQEGNEDLMKQITLQSGSRAKTLNSLPHTGYERMAVGRGLIIMDTGKPPKWPHDTTSHAAPLAFEMSYGRERIIVNCGTHPTNPEWQDMLRFTAAHTTLTIDDRNAYEIHKDGSLSRKAKKVSLNREDKIGMTAIEASHDGYVPVNGITHRRTLYYADQGHDLRGEDTLTCTTGLTKPHKIAARFHLHPKVSVSLVKDGEEAILALPGGTGWRFTACGAPLSLEDSIYMGDGVRPRKSKQLVITADMTEDNLQIKWALQRELL
ncbi:MAG: heparinase [Micavibrio aeruginosavorus]|uniref:Heparinase n=1 Tax=Micavibrio aeruginosavorus TaxID=349221 RepID=A0A2W5N3I2_9BACT|nr:MAG: heparinase [Micavibrio aeruginosavorus]